MPTETFFPKLSSVVRIESFPEQLSFIQDGLNNLLDKLYYRDFQFVQSQNGDSNFYSLVLVSHKKLSIDIPGTGLALIFNPGHSGNTSEISEFPIELSYQIPILSYVKGFKLDNFSFEIKELYNLILKIIKIDDSSLILNTTNVFLNESLNSLVDEINSKYNLSGVNIIPYPINPDPQLAVEEIINSIINNEELSSQGISVPEIIFTVFLNNIDVNKIIENVNLLFLQQIGDSPIDYIKSLFEPKISFSIGLSAGLEFPRNILTPLDVNGNVISEPETCILIFEAGDLTFNSESGIGFGKEMFVTLNHPAQIGNTGFTIGFSKIYFDLSRKTNIPQATLAGYSDDFVGVYIEEAEIGLPPKWFKQEIGTTLELYGEKIIAGTGGFSGKIGLRTIAPGHPLPLPEDELTIRLGGSDTEPDKGFLLGFSEFDLVFERNSIVESSISGSLTLPNKLKEDESDPIPVTIPIKAHFNSNGDFNITGSYAAGIPIPIKDVLELKITELEIGRVEDDFYIETKGELKITLSPISDYIKDPIQIKKLKIWDNGKIEFVGGGNLVLPEPKSLKIGPVDLTVTAFHFGTHEQVHGINLRKYMYIGFDGGVSINPGGVDARGDGISQNYQNKKVA